MATKKAPNRVSGFSRDASNAFMDPKKEAFAKSWAKNGLMKEACEEADISPPTGTTWRRHAEMEERIRELRATSETYVGISKAYIVSQLRMNALNAATAGKYRESNDALIALFKITNTDKDLAPGLDAGATGPAADMTPEQLAEERAKAFPSAKQLPASTRMVEDEDGVWTPGPEIEVTHMEPALMLTVKYGELAKPFEGPLEDET